MKEQNQVKLLVDMRDESGDTDLFVPAGEIVEVVSNEDDSLIVKTLDGKWCFSVEYNEVEAA